MTIGDKIVHLRKQKGMSQELLAERAKVSLRTVQRLEKESVLPRLHTVSNIANALGVSMEELAPPLADLHIEDELVLLRKMNHATLLAFIPFSNLIVPYVHYKRALPKQKSSAAQRLLSFQLVWVLLTLLTLVAVQLTQYFLTGSVMLGRVSILWPTYLLCCLINLAFGLRTALHIKNSAMVKIYAFMPSLL